MLVKDLAERTGVPAHVIRYYTQRGLLTPRRDPNNRYRNYSLADIGRVHFIRRVKRLGFTLRDIGAILGDVDKGSSPYPRARRLIEQRAHENKARIKELSGLQISIEQTMTSWGKMCDESRGTGTLPMLVESIGLGETDLNSVMGGP